MAFVKLDRGLLSSSLWIQGDAETVRVWMFLLLSADGRGVVEETLPAIAHGCKLSIDRAQAILGGFESADPFSRTPALEGRRIIVTREPRWAIRIINFVGYREKDHGAAARMRRYRQKKRPVTRNDRNATSTVTQGRGQKAEGRSQRESREDGREGGSSRGDELPASRLSPQEEAARESLAERLLAEAAELAAAAGIKTEQAIEEASRIEAGNGYPEKAFRDPRANGVSMAWIETTLTQGLPELRARLTRLDRL